MCILRRGDEAAADGSSEARRGMEGSEAERESDGGTEARRDSIRVGSWGLPDMMSAKFSDFLTPSPLASIRN